MEIGKTVTTIGITKTIPNNEVNVVYGDDDVEEVLCLPVKNEDAQVKIKSKCYSKEQLLYYIRNRKTIVKKLMK